MVHGGYVAGIVAERFAALREGRPGAVQVTLRKPTPFDRPLVFESDSTAALRLTSDGETLVEAAPAELELTLPAPPSPEQARAAEAGSPSHYEGRGVHPSCFGCSALRDPGDALRIFAGPCEVGGRSIVAAAWRPVAPFAGAAGEVPLRYVVSALDCPGAFAFIVERKRAGLLGRLVFESYRPVRADAEHVVVGFQVGEQGRKLFAGTALFDAAGVPCAAAKATWFGFPG